MEDDFYSQMYGRAPAAPTPKTSDERAKQATRVLGGMKVHGSHTKVLEIEGELVNIPRAEYIKLLEDQIRDMRNKVRDMEAKQARQIRAMSKIQEELRRVRTELANKIDAH